MKILPLSSQNYTSKNLNQDIQTNLSFEARFPNGLKKPKHVKNFLAFRDYAKYNPLSMDFGKYKIPVHNEGIAQKLKPSYTSEDFNELYNFAKKKGVSSQYIAAYFGRQL